MSEVHEATTRQDVLRHRVGTCPACREYLWADVTIESRMTEPTLTIEGKASVFASARPVAMQVAHECQQEDA